MVVLAAGFRPNTALGAGKLETFRNGAYLVNKKQKHQSKMFYAVGGYYRCINALDDVNCYGFKHVRSGVVGGHNASGKRC